MSLLLSVSWHGVNSCAPDKMPVTIEAIEAHDCMPAYYRLMLGGVWYVITDAHRRQILDALSSAPDLPKTDAQIDAEAEAARNIPVSALPNWRGGPMLNSDVALRGQQQLLTPEQAAQLPDWVTPTPMEMIAAIARDPTIPIDRITALIGLQERMEAREAEKAYNQDFALAMLAMPRVAKHGRKDMREKGCIMYATYEDIDAAVRPIESNYGFARSFATRQADKGTVMTLRLTHRAGHSTTSERFCRPDPGPGRNEIQAEGSGESYSRRYLTLAVWNIVTVGADDDGNSADPISEQQAWGIRDMLDTLAMTPPRLAKFWAWAEATSPENIQRRNYDRINAELAKQLKAGGR